MDISCTCLPKCRRNLFPLKMSGNNSPFNFGSCTCTCTCTRTRTRTRTPASRGSRVRVCHRRPQFLEGEERWNGGGSLEVCVFSCLLYRYYHRYYPCYPPFCLFLLFSLSLSVCVSIYPFYWLIYIYCLSLVLIFILPCVVLSSCFLCMFAFSIFLIDILIDR